MRRRLETAMKPPIASASLPILLLVVTGCARFEYEIVEPPSLAGHVGRQWVELHRDPLLYRLCSYENRLVVEIHNPTSEPIRLAGDRSFVAAPDGQSHPLLSQSIGPRTYIRIPLPPLQIYYAPRGMFNFGIGMGYGYGGHFHPYYGYPWYGYAFYPPYDPFWYGPPRYYAVYNDADRLYWEWTDESQIRLTLAFEQGPGKTFVHDFTIRRKRM